MTRMFFAQIQVAAACHAEDGRALCRFSSENSQLPMHNNANYVQNICKLANRTDLDALLVQTAL